MTGAPKLRKNRVGKTTSWFTATGGAPVYFGNVDEVSYEEARTAFRDYLESLSAGREHRNSLTCLELMNHFRAWVEQYRSRVTFEQIRRDGQRFANFTVNGVKIADLPATRVNGRTWNHGWRVVANVIRPAGQRFCTVRLR